MNDSLNIADKFTFYWKSKLYGPEVPPTAMRVDIYKISHNYYYLENQYCTQNSCCFCAILCILEHKVLSDFDQIMEYVKRLYIKLYF